MQLSNYVNRFFHNSRSQNVCKGYSEIFLQNLSQQMIQKRKCAFLNKYFSGNEILIFQLLESFERLTSGEMIMK